jgi:hypothetical protein
MGDTFGAESRIIIEVENVKEVSQSEATESEETESGQNIQH